jgi:hypothetical protein
MSLCLFYHDRSRAGGRRGSAPVKASSSGPLFERVISMTI